MRTIATAGHVDHGKSSLVLALTGTDPDRFAGGEGARAHHRPRVRLHARSRRARTSPSSTCPATCASSRTCSPGVGAVDARAARRRRRRRLDAADRGAPPHPRAARCRRHGVVAITKADSVDADTLELAQLEVGERLAASALACCPGGRVRFGESGAGSTSSASSSTRCSRTPPSHPITVGRGCGSIVHSPHAARGPSSPARSPVAPSRAATSSRSSRTGAPGPRAGDPEWPRSGEAGDARCTRRPEPHRRRAPCDHAW